MMVGIEGDTLTFEANRDRAAGGFVSSGESPR
jgi:hypothetical protein